MKQLALQTSCFGTSHLQNYERGNVVFKAPDLWSSVTIAAGNQDPWLNLGFGCMSASVFFPLGDSSPRSAQS